MDNKLDEARKQARAELEAAGAPGGLSEDEIKVKVEASATFKAVDEKYGIGSPFWTAGTAATGLLAGVLGGNVQSGAAAATAPLLAKLIKEATADKGKAGEVARIALHTLASAVLAKAQGGDAAAGAAGGFIASAGTKAFAMAIYGKDADQLAPDEKMVILNLVSALSAAGGGAVTGNTQGMVSAGNAARVEVENNALGDKDKELGLQDIRPGWLKPGTLDGDGKLNLGAGRISGKYSINKGQQNKHIEGTNEYKTAAASSGNQRSILIVEPQSLLPQLGTGQLVGKVAVGQPGSKERVGFGKVIGNYVDKDTGLSLPTTKGIVHDGKDGAHIVPARP